jgi:uncharacterized membrane protein
VIGALFFLGLALAAPVLAVASLVRSLRMQRELAELRAELDRLERRVSALGARPSPAVAPQPAVAPPPKPAPPPPEAVAPPPPPRPAPEPPKAPPRPVEPAAAVPRRPPEPPPPAPPRPPPAAPESPAFDWESLLGVRGAAWLGGVALVVAAIFFAKWAIDRGLITPELRIALLLLAGVGSLAWAEISLRRGFETTANAVSGAGIAILYIAFFAAYSLYHLLPLAVTFAMMALVTVVAGLLSIRYDAVFTAGLGLLGGFATPLVLSTGVDHPVGLFSYVLLLNLGIFTVAIRKRWPGFVLLALLGTFVIEVGWFGRFMSPEKMAVGLTAFLVLGLLYLVLPIAAAEEDDAALLQAGAAGATVPFVFAIALAGSARYAGEWPLLFGYLALLDAALVAIALLRGRIPLLIAGAAATAVTLPLWAGQGLARDRLWGPTIAAAGLVMLLNLPGRIGARWFAETLEEKAAGFELAGLAAWTGLGLYALVLVLRGLDEPPWAFLALLVVLTALLLERTRAHRVPGALLVGAFASSILIQIWFFHGTTGETLLRNLSVPLLFALALSIAAATRARVPADADEDDGGVVAAAFLAIAGVFGCLTSPELGRDPWPLFGSLALATVLVLLSGLRRDWPVLVPITLVVSAFFAFAWHDSYFHPSDVRLVLPIEAAFYVAFLALPFAAARWAARWTTRAEPWLASAIAGPLFFFVFYRAVVDTWGKGFIAAVPLALAAGEVAALAGVERRFRPGTEVQNRRRLDYLALFAAIALGFVAVAVPLQLDRQWITIGWALEAAAVWWLYRRLPHPALKLFGTALFVTVGVRLLLNPEVLRYQERGRPILNWLLYTYGVPALCCFAGAAFLARGAARRPRAALGANLLGLLLIFWLINGEIADYFSEGRYVEFTLERQFARDLTMSAAWAIYAVALLLIGIWRGVRSLRFLSLGFLLLTVAKVGVYDLANLPGLYRILSFAGLAAVLILVSLLYQRFVFLKERPS